MYFPYSSGLLWKYSSEDKFILDHYELQPFLFKREPVDKILEYYDNPDVACFSCSMWNWRLNLAIAQAVKDRYPKCLIIFGGPQVPVSSDFYSKYPFVDIGVFGEGEMVLKNLLIKNINDRSKLPYGSTIKNPEVTKDLDLFPSPYSSGLFDYMIKENPDLEFKAIVETNRSCPFHCSFCFWGQSALNKKIAYHSLEYIKKEVEWFAKNKIKYIFCADANFGMYKRDTDIAKIYTSVKREIGYPERFRVCYGKNVIDNVFEAASILSNADLAKTVTISIQSNSPKVLSNIRRDNIKTNVFEMLQRRYSEAGISTYTEMILGLPGETYESFLQGLEFVMNTSTTNQIFIYHCQVLVNSELSDPDYMKKFGIKTSRVPIAEAHGSVRDESIVPEFEDIIVETESMNREDWKRSAIIAWILQTFHGLKAAHKIVYWLKNNHNIKITEFFEFVAKYQTKEVQFFEKVADDILRGIHRCKYDSRFGSIYYEPEELAFLSICMEPERFYGDLKKITSEFLKSKGVDDPSNLESVFRNQMDKIPRLAEGQSTKDFATNIILYGRKSNIAKNEAVI